MSWFEVVYFNFCHLSWSFFLRTCVPSYTGDKEAAKLALPSCSIYLSNWGSSNYGNFSELHLSSSHWIQLTWFGEWLKSCYQQKIRYKLLPSIRIIRVEPKNSVATPNCLPHTHIHTAHTHTHTHDALRSRGFYLHGWLRYIRFLRLITTHRKVTNCISTRYLL